MMEIPKTQAIEALREVRARAGKLKKLRRGGTDFIKWTRDGQAAIRHIFGEASSAFADFAKIRYTAITRTNRTPDSAHQLAYAKGLSKAEAIIDSMIDEIEMFWPDDTTAGESPVQPQVGKAAQSPSKPPATAAAQNSALSVGSSTTNWKAIGAEYDETKNSFGRKINFVTGEHSRRIIFRDVEHAFLLSRAGFAKPAVTLAGSVIEELLRLYLAHNNILSRTNNFNAYIEACEEHDLLKDSVSRLSDSVRRFRNLVHLEAEETKKHSISKATAIGAVSSIFTIANDF